MKPKRTPAEKKHLADVFRRAADIMADRRRCQFGCCRAIEKVLLPRTGYRTPEHQVFKAAFPWLSGGAADYREHWQDRPSFNSYPEDAREARVLALHFCAAMVEAGDL